MTEAFWRAAAQHAAAVNRERITWWVQAIQNRPPEVATILRKESEMPIIAKAGGGGTFKPVSAGLHPAICTGVIDLGMQEGTERFPKPKHKIHIRWSCLDEEVEWEKDGVQHRGPAIVSGTYTLSLHEQSRLRPLLEAWRGRRFTEAELEGFDIERLAGVPCQVQVVHETRGDKTYAVAQAVVGWPKGQPVPTCSEPVLVYSCKAPDPVTFALLPEWLRTRIQQRVADDLEDLDRKRGGGHAAAASSIFDDDETVPF